jgi:diacylglycerol kinase family enzyme
MIKIEEHRFAVVLNRNAKRVTEQIEQISGELVHPDDLFLSSSAEESESIARTVIDRKYETVFAGGGDGTVMQLINQLAKYPAHQQPHVGILKLGTGNAMARMVSSGNIEGDLKTYISSSTRETLALSLVETEGQRCPFTGIGVDAQILNDYRSVKDSLGNNPVMKPILQTVGGYFLSFFSKTAPRRTRDLLLGQELTVKVVVTRGTAYRLSPEGHPVKTFSAGDTLYDGPIIAALAGTIPYYGYGMKVLPFAGLDSQRFHLRLAQMGTMEALSKLPAIWKGEPVRGGGMTDFLAQGVELSLNRPAPFQIGGDAAGERDSVRFDIVPDAVRLLKLL